MRIFAYRELTRRGISIPLILLGALLLTLPIFLNGIPKGNDLAQHFQFASTYHAALMAGDLIPSLSTTTNHGFGDVGVRFYPPLSYIVLAGLRITTGNWHEAACVAFALWMFLGGLGVYLWSQDHFNETASLIAAFVYMIAPYHVNQVYNASLFAEFAAAGILPFCFLFASRTISRPAHFNCVGLAVSFSLLLLTHLPTALIGSIGLAVFAVASIRPIRLRPAIAFATSIVAGLLLSSFYLVKLLCELTLVKHSSTEFIERAYDFRLNFVGSYFYLAPTVYADGAQWFIDMLGLTAACLFVPTVVLYFLSTERETRGRFVEVAAVFAAAVFFATPLSSPVWENVALLQKLQFPYRWLVLVNLSGAFFVAAAWKYVLAAFRSNLRPVALATGGLILAAFAFSVAQVIRPAIYVPAAEVEDYVAALSEAPSYECWLAVWARKAAFADDRYTNDPSATTEQWDDHEKRIEFGPNHLPEVRLRLFYYPLWRAEVDGRPADVFPDKNGALTVKLPDGPVRGKVFFQEPFRVTAGAVVSGIAWAMALLWVLFHSVRKLKTYVNRYSN
ncbi:MAG: 6-pyruvoyl-tetrahydropterin synthase-related protein [Pyrinomonadaceae bacterium]